jgi:hypothetical protein
MEDGCRHPGRDEASCIVIVATIALWLVALPQVVRDLTMRSIAEDLSAWLVLRNTFETPLNATHGRASPIQQPSVEGDSAEIGQLFYEEHDDEDPPQPMPILLSSPWPRPFTTPATLVRVEQRLYDIRAETPLLPFDRYSILFTSPDDEEHGEWLPYVTVVRRDPELGADERRFQYRSDNWQIHPDMPHMRSEIVASVLPLSAPDEVALDAHSLSFVTPSVSKFLTDSRPAERSVLGLPVDSGLFFSAIGLALGALSFGLVGPTLVLNSSREAADTHWTMAVRVHGPLRGTWEGVLVLLSGLLVVSPIGVVALQAWMTRALSLRTREVVPIIAGRPAAAAAAAVLAGALREVTRVRRGVQDAD